MKEKKTNNKMELIMTIIVLVLILAILGWLGYGYYKKQTLNVQNPIATIEVEKYGTIKVELYPEKAPDTVANFVRLANNGVYDGSTYHRVIKDFMIQGGRPKGNETGEIKLSDLNTGMEKGSNEDKEYVITGEFAANGYTSNDLILTEGTIAMARKDFTQYSPTLAEESYNSASSEFFIMTTNDNTGLTGYYAGFGKVIEGLDVVKDIAKVKVTSEAEKDKDNESANTEKSIPTKDVVITSIKVETYGVDYEMPKTLEPFDFNSWLSSMYGVSY